jgi:hypothetical protein
VRDQVSHPYKTTGEVAIVCILILELNNLYSSAYKIKGVRCAGHIACMGDMRNA